MRKKRIPQYRKHTTWFNLLLALGLVTALRSSIAVRPYRVWT